MNIQEKLRIMSRYDEVYNKIWDINELEDYWKEITEVLDIDKADDKKMRTAIAEISVASEQMKKIEKQSLKDILQEELKENLKVINAIAESYL